jgi:hypothetical protein
MPQVAARLCLVAPVVERRASLRAARAVRPGRVCRTAVASAASDVVKEAKTGLSFPARLRCDDGTELTCLGAGCRSKALLGPIAVNVYGCALFVDATAARDATAACSSVDACAAALLDGAFHRALLITFARTVTPQQFLDALSAELRTRLPAGTGGEALAAFSVFVNGLTLDKGSSVLLTARPDGSLEVSSAAPQVTPGASPGACFASPPFTRALLSVYLAPDTIVPAAREAWVAGARQLPAAAA